MSESTLLASLANVISLLLEETALEGRIAEHATQLMYQAKRLAIQEEEPDFSLIASKLQRPLAFFDLETTGVSVSQDRVVQMHITILNPDASLEEFSYLFNPTIPIPEAATAVHGISNEAVAGCLNFNYYASEIYSILEGCDLATFNGNHFDNPFLSEEFDRCDITFPLPETLLIDVSNIFREKEGRSLADCFRFYTGKSLEGAHDAGNDVKATAVSLAKQLAIYEDVAKMDIQQLHQFSKANEKAIDLAGKLMYDENGFACYAFGKEKGKRVKDQPSYANWMLQADFPRDTKAHIELILDSCCTN